MNSIMKLINQQQMIKSLFIIYFSTQISACGNSANEQSSATNHAHGAHNDIEIKKGSHGGRLSSHGDFSLELAIFETGVAPEFRAWVSFKGQSLKPSEVELNISLARLGGKVDKINFKPHGDALRGDSVIYEPHSFIVNIDAIHKGIQYNWQYDNFEGRTKIESAVAKALAINTETAGPVVLKQNIKVFGKIMANTERVSHVSARFAGVIKSVSASIGDTVRKGQVLASVESNESLKLYKIKSPINGTITQRSANVGEQTGAQALFIIADTSSVWVDLSIFPADQQHVKPGDPVSFTLMNQSRTFAGKIAMINILAEANQSVTARVIVNNAEGLLFPASFVNAKIIVGEHPVLLAVKRSGLQPFRELSVVYEQIGEEYEVRMLKLGRHDDEWIEVLSGLEEGARYVSKNSYVVKADIEKSGATHDH